jgi:hypothetical protein
MKKTIIILIFIIALICVMISSIYTYRVTQRCLININSNNQKTLLFYKAEEICSYIAEKDYLFKRFYEKILNDKNNISKIKNDFKYYFNRQNYIARLVLLSKGKNIFSLNRDKKKDKGDFLRAGIDLNYLRFFVALNSKI